MRRRCRPMSAARALALVVLLLASVAVAASPAAGAESTAGAEPAADAEAGADAVALAASATATNAWDVRVGDIDADGQFRGVAGLRVELIPLRMGQNGDVEQGDPIARSTGVDGRIAIPSEAEPGALLVRYDAEGGRAVATLEAYRTRLGRFARKLADADLQADARINLEVGDSGLRAWMLLTLRTSASGVRRWSADAPLALPMLAPVLGDIVLDQGLFPDGVRSVNVQVQGDAEVVARNGVMQLIGSVAPSRPLVLRVAYPIAVTASTLRLGFRGLFDETRVTVAVVAVEPGSPRITSARPARIGSHREGRERLVGMALLQPLEQGEVAHVALHDLPVRARAPGRALAAAVGLVMLLGLGVAAAGPRGWQGRLG